ncbi:MAG TPA: hypothetical protein PKE30_04425 [Niabella sp.]|nr:hypothetical protein [Niabella sp.]
MKYYLNISMAALLVMLLLGACKKEKQDPEEDLPESKITLTKAADDNTGWRLEIQSSLPYTPESVWIDLNNNGVKDNGEGLAKAGTSETFPLSAKTITVYGKVYTLICNNNKLTSLNVSGNKYLSYLSCTGNELTQLDVSKSEGLRTLLCNSNKLITLDLSKNTDLNHIYVARNAIAGENMKQFLNNIPARPSDGKGILRLMEAPDGNSRPAAADLNACKGKNWIIQEWKDSQWKEM